MRSHRASFQRLKIRTMHILVKFWNRRFAGHVESADQIQMVPEHLGYLLEEIEYARQAG